jgi:hypothetical protein
MLQRGLKLNPEGIDSNYFYADFLANQGKKEEAKSYLLKAKAAATRPGREIADAGRQREIAVLQEKLDQ